MLLARITTFNFQKVRSVCDKSQSKPLYDRLIQIIINYANQLKAKLDEGDEVPLAEENCEEYLRKFGKIWAAFPLKIVSDIWLFVLNYILFCSEPHPKHLSLPGQDLPDFRRNRLSSAMGQFHADIPENILSGDLEGVQVDKTIQCSVHGDA